MDFVRRINTILQTSSLRGKIERIFRVQFIIQLFFVILENTDWKHNVYNHCWSINFEFLSSEHVYNQFRSQKESASKQVWKIMV